MLSILNLKAVLVEYNGIVEGVTNVNILEWWVMNEDTLLNWAVAYKKIVLCQPSSSLQSGWSGFNLTIFLTK